MDPKEVVSKALHSINDGTYNDVAQDMYSKKAVLKDKPTGRQLTGPEGAIEYSQMWMTALPDAQIEILEQAVDGDRVETIFVVRGTFTGSMPTPDGVTLEGNGQAIEIEVTQRVEVGKKGKIKRATHDYDLDDLMEQLELDMEEDMDEQTQDEVKEEMTAGHEHEAGDKIAAEEEAKDEAVAEMDDEEADNEEEEEVVAEVEREAQADAEDEEEDDEAVAEMDDEEAEDEESEDEEEAVAEVESEGEHKPEAAEEAAAEPHAEEHANGQSAPAAEAEPTGD